MPLGASGARHGGAGQVIEEGGERQWCEGERGRPGG
jgi:hypothetical protein